jgi:serpin B
MTHGHEADVRVYRDGAVEVLDLPYGGRAFSMTIVMPAEPAGIDALVAGLTLEQWDGWIAGLDSAASEVYLPKFVRRRPAAKPRSAPGDGIAFACDPGHGRLHPDAYAEASRAWHKSFVDVNEGTRRQRHRGRDGRDERA